MRVLFWHHYWISKGSLTSWARVVCLGEDQVLALVQTRGPRAVSCLGHGTAFRSGTCRFRLAMKPHHQLGASVRGSMNGRGWARSHGRLRTGTTDTLLAPGRRTAAGSLLLPVASIRPPLGQFSRGRPAQRCGGKPRRSRSPSRAGRSPLARPKRWVSTAIAGHYEGQRSRTFAVTDRPGRRVAAAR